MSSRFSTFEHSIGVSVSDTSSDTSTEKVIASPYWKKKRPTTPLMKAIGMKTAQIEKVAASTASPTSLVPSAAARIGDNPLSSLR